MTYRKIFLPVVDVIYHVSVLLTSLHSRWLRSCACQQKEINSMSILKIFSLTFTSCLSRHGPGCANAWVRSFCLTWVWWCHHCYALHSLNLMSLSQMLIPKMKAMSQMIKGMSWISDWDSQSLGWDQHSSSNLCWCFFPLRVCLSSMIYETWNMSFDIVQFCYVFM